jgi:protein involved in polysaccharide export with SLBB domain
MPVVRVVRKDAMRRTLRNSLRCLQFGLALLAFLLSGFVVEAQQSRRGPTIASELVRENLNRVAASAVEIELVLRKEPGLMVELKRWVAKDAADHGQVVSDPDLADRAIYDRLTRDVEFRSVATRLLERYGYLLPRVDPDSEMADERKLVLQARANEIARAAQKEEQTSVPSTGALGPLQQTNLCGPDTMAIPRRLQPPYIDPNGPAPYMDPNAPNEAIDQVQNLDFDCVPLPQGGRTQQGSVSYAAGSERLSNIPAYAPLQPDLDQDDQMAPYQNLPFPPASQGAGASQLMQARLGAAGGGNQSPLGQAPIDLSSLDEMGAASAAGVLSGGEPTSQPGTNLGQIPSPGNGNLLQPEFRPFGRTARKQLPPTMVRQPNPYSDIPSLYDMYQQAPPRSARLQRFGMEVFGDAIRNPNYIPMDLPVGPDYVLGPGDGLTINLWGGVSRRLFRTVDREGRVALPEAGPVLVNGRTLGQVQEEVQQILRTQFRDVSADISLSRLRTIRVYVVGDVEHPGAYDINSLSTPLNALFAAGGPTQVGSLRLLKHYRGKQLVQDVDIYDLLLHGTRSDLERLENGDTVLVPPMSAQVRVEGMVRRPAIYELNGEKSLADALQLAGGILPAATVSHIEVQRLNAHEKHTMLSLDIPDGADLASVEKQLESFSVQDDDTVHVFPIAPFNKDAVYLEGHVLRPGKFSYRPGMKLTDLVSSYSDLLPEPATKYAEIIRLNAPDYRPSVESFDLAAALADPAAAPKLEPLDTVRVFGRYDFQTPPVVSVLGDVRAPGTYRTDGQIHLRDAIQLAGGLTPDAELDNAQVFQYSAGSQMQITTVNLKAAFDGNPIDNILLEPRDRIVVHRNVAKADPPIVTIAGEVSRPGRYPLTANLHVGDLIRLAGGLRRSADPEGADLTSYASKSDHTAAAHQKIDVATAMAGDPNSDPPLREGDVLTIPAIAGWADRGASIDVRGEVTRPGTYGIRSGDRLSTILKLAGGFQPEAYPYGTVLERPDVRDFEEKSRAELVERVRGAQTDLKNAALTETDPHKKIEKEAAYQQWQTTLETLTAYPPTGRLTIRVSSDIHRWENTPADIQVRNGDVLVIPKKPSYVMVSGQVFNSTAVSYQPGKSANWYLGQAGGPTPVANKKAIFVIRADGNVIGSKGSGWWGGNSLNAVLQPGDTIVVPERALAVGPNWPALLQAAQLATSISYTAILAIR